MRLRAGSLFGPGGQDQSLNAMMFNIYDTVAAALYDDDHHHEDMDTVFLYYFLYLFCLLTFVRVAISPSSLIPILSTCN